MPGDDYNVDSFKEFFEGWLLRQRLYLDELLSAERRLPYDGADLDDLISRVLSHYEEYYEKKSRIAQRDIFLVFSPTWFTPYERSLLWIGGFRPGLVFRLVNNSINNMSNEQALRIRRLRNDVKIDERMLNNELAKIQEKVAAPPLLELFRRNGNGGVTGGAIEMGTMKAAFQAVLASADFLRRDTALKVAAILTPAQTVGFWTAVIQLQLLIRDWGLQKDAESRDPSSGGVR